MAIVQLKQIKQRSTNIHYITLYHNTAYTPLFIDYNTNLIKPKPKYLSFSSIITAAMFVCQDEGNVTIGTATGTSTEIASSSTSIGIEPSGVLSSGVTTVSGPATPLLSSSPNPFQTDTGNADGQDGTNSGLGQSNQIKLRVGIGVNTPTIIITLLA